MTKTAVILAAGEGKRLRPYTIDTPKCLVKINGTPIIDNALRALVACGCSKVIIVIGHLGDRIRRDIGTHYSGMDIKYVENTEYQQTNSMYSLSLALRDLNESTWVLEGDVFFELGLLQRSTETPLTWFVDSTGRHLDGAFIELGPCNLAMRLMIIRDISEIGNNMGKSVGMLKLTKEGVSLLRFWLWQAIVSGRTNDYYDLIIGDQMPDERIKVADVSGHKWYEIDTPEDLIAASHIFHRQ